MQRIYTHFETGRVGLALLFLRLIVGIAFVFHGWPLIHGPERFAAALKVPVWFAAVGAWSQFAGGILLVLGLLTPLAALFLLGAMAGALAMVHIPHHDPFVNPKGPNFELAAVFGVTMIAFLLAGPGAYSLDALLARRMNLPREVAPGRSRGLA